MTKKRTNITLDPQIYRKAKAKGINVSRLTEEALRRYIRRLEGREAPKSGPFGEVFMTGGGRPSKGEGGPKDPDQTIEEFLEDFRRSCQVDWNLAESTTRERRRYAKKLVEHLGCHPLEASKDQLREFIDHYGDHNAVKTVRVIYGRYFGRELAESFKIPKSSPPPREIPDKSGLRDIYSELDTAKIRAAYLLLASSGLRRGELMNTAPNQLEPEKRTIYPPESGENRRTKRQWVTFYNREAEQALEKLDLENMDPEKSIFANSFCPQRLTTKIGKASEQAGTVRTTPQTLRVWFADEMNRLGVADRYIDAFCGRTPKSVLARHYTDFSPRRLREVYEEAGLEVLE